MKLLLRFEFSLRFSFKLLEPIIMVLLGKSLFPSFLSPILFIDKISPGVNITGT